MVGSKSGAILLATPFKKLLLYTRIVFLIFKACKEAQVAVRIGSKLDKMLNGSKKPAKGSR
jgi:hypothetical protein